MGCWTMYGPLLSYTAAWDKHEGLSDPVGIQYTAASLFTGDRKQSRTSTKCWGDRMRSPSGWERSPGPTQHQAVVPLQPGCVHLGARAGSSHLPFGLIWSQVIATEQGREEAECKWSPWAFEERRV